MVVNVSEEVVPMQLLWMVVDDAMVAQQMSYELHSSKDASHGGVDAVVVVLDDAVDVVDNEAHIQQRVDEVPAGVAVVDRVVFRVGVAIERLRTLLEASKAIPLQESSQHRMVVPRPQVDQPSGRILQLVSEP